MKAKDIMVTDVPVISRKALGVEALQMLRKNFGDESFLNAAPGLIVLNEKGELAGILSPLSVIKALLDSAEKMNKPCGQTEAYYEKLCKAIKDKLVEDIMDWQPISVTEDANLMELAALFAEHRFQRVPVVRGKSVVGVIYRSRLLFAMTKCLL